MKFDKAVDLVREAGLTGTDNTNTLALMVDGMASVLGVVFEVEYTKRTDRIKVIASVDPERTPFLYKTGEEV